MAVIAAKSTSYPKSWQKTTLENKECKKDECLTNEICNLKNIVWMTPIRFQNK